MPHANTRWLRRSAARRWTLHTQVVLFFAFRLSCCCCCWLGGAGARARPAMPLPLELVIASDMRLPLGDDELFPWLNVVGAGWALIALLPRWRHTPALSMGVVAVYSVLYTVLLAERMRTAPLPEGASVGTLEGVAALFGDRGVIMAGCEHSRRCAHRLGVAVRSAGCTDARAAVRRDALHCLRSVRGAVDRAGCRAGRHTTPCSRVAAAADADGWAGWLDGIPVPGQARVARARVDPGGAPQAALCRRLGALPVDGRVGAVLPGLVPVRRLAGRARRAARQGVRRRRGERFADANASQPAHQVLWASGSAGASRRDRRTSSVLYPHGCANSAAVLCPTHSGCCCCVLCCVMPSVPQLTHILPSAVWSLAIPIQLNPAMRSHYKGLHRATGLAFFGCAGLMALGLTLIDGRNLFYFVVDFPSIPTHESMSAFRFMEHSSVDSFKTKY